MNRYILCYAEGRPGQWEAFCLDFDIAVQGDTFEEVYSSLSEGVANYIAYVSELPSSERRAFMRRKSPLSLRFRFIWYAISLLFNGRAGAKERHEFIAHCPA